MNCKNCINFKNETKTLPFKQQLLPLYWCGVKGQTDDKKGSYCIPHKHTLSNVYCPDFQNSPKIKLQSNFFFLEGSKKENSFISFSFIEEEKS